MNQWPTLDARLLCTRHVLGVHGESHKFLPSWAKRISATGWIKNDCFEPESYKDRHDEAEEELARRGGNHRSPLSPPDFSYLPPDEQKHRVDHGKVKMKLADRCWDCRQGLLRNRSYY